MGKYIQYYIKNVQPLRFADDNTSQTGQCDTVSYIPGTSVRGAVINGIVKRDKEKFEEMKQRLFSDKVKFLNCYPVFDKKIALPSPKGFYQQRGQKEDKQKVQCVLKTGKTDSDYNKKASLSPFAYWDEEECIYHRDVKKKDDLNIWLAQGENQEKKIFRNTYIDRGQSFLGLIAVEEEDIADAIAFELRRGEMRLGSRHTAGYGKCVVEDVKQVECSPYEEYAVKSDLEGECYLYLLSDMAMVNEYGENTGLNEEYLAKLLDKEQVKVTGCATSAGTARGRNATWGFAVSTVPVYQKGSVFKLNFEGTLAIEAIKRLEYTGLGIKRNEGFGQVLFLKDYERLDSKKKAEQKKTEYVPYDCAQEDRESLSIMAKGYYVNLLKKRMISYVVNEEKDFQNISDSQIGGLHALITSCKFYPKEVTDKLKQYFKHGTEKEEENKRIGSTPVKGPLQKTVMNIMDQDINKLLKVNECLKTEDTVMGIPIKELLQEGEEEGFKMQLLIMIFEYIWREGKMDE